MFKEIVMGVVVLVIIGFGIWYWMNHHQTEGEYVWVGPGQDPFKKESDDKKD